MVEPRNVAIVGLRSVDEIERLNVRGAGVHPGDRGRVGGHRLVGRKQRDVCLFEVAVDPGRVGGHA